MSQRPQRSPIRELLTELRLDGTEPEKALPPDEMLSAVDKRQDIRLKKMYGYWMLGLLSAQLFICDVAFYLYASLGRAWNLPPAVISIWLSATVVEMIGVVTAITLYLFPATRSAK